MTTLKSSILKGALLLSPLALALLLVGGYWLSKSELQNEAEREAPVRNTVRFELVAGKTVLTMDTQAQQISDIQTQPVGPVTASDGAAIYGTVVEVLPLADLAGRRAAALAEREAAQAAMDAAQAESARLRTLYADDNNISLKSLQAAKSAEAAARSKISAAELAVLAADDAMRTQYGQALAKLAAMPGANRLAPFLSGDAALLRMALPEGAVPPASLTMRVDGHDITATLVAASPQADPGFPGSSYFYRIVGALATGTRVQARLPLAQRRGVLIPTAALVWYGGQPWAYVRVAANRFERRALRDGHPADGGLLAVDGFAAGERIVVAGAQLLLSEESRSLLNKD